MNDSDLYHTKAFDAAGAAISTFTPINRIHQHLCAFHVYSHDTSRGVRAHHYCTHLRKDLHQCIIYDSDKADARLIGIEYIVSEEIFKSLSDAEKVYWHSHNYEITSGMLMLGTKSLVPNAVTDVAEQPAFLELQKTYGKTVHTWQYDIHPDLPLGPPALMLAFTKDGQLDDSLLKRRDEELGVDTARKRQWRETYLPSYTVAQGCDQTDQGWQLQLVRAKT